MSLSKIGKPGNRKGFKDSKETRQKMSLAKMGNTAHLGKKHSPEAKLKMSMSQKNRPPRKPCSEETKQKIRTANTGQKRSVETKMNISASRKGLLVSLETRKKLSESGKAYWNRIKKVGN
jgi:hypothetical protein